MFNPDDENDRQAAIRRDRDFSTLDATDRLAWANAASTPAEIAAEQAAKASAEAQRYNAAQRQYLDNLRSLRGVETEDDLTEEEAEMLAFWGGQNRMGEMEERAAKAETDKPLALRTLDEAAMADLPGPARLEIANAFEVVKESHRARAEGRAYDINAGRLEGAILRCRKYLK